MSLTIGALFAGYGGIEWDRDASRTGGFPLGYPWRGSKTSQYRQVGNAIPPALAAHTLAALGVGDPTRLETAA